MQRDVSGWKVRLTLEIAARHAATSAWRNRTIVDEARDRTREDAGATLLIDGDRLITRDEVMEKARRLAAAFRRRGLEPGAVISFQLPNWHEASIVNLAAAMCGLVVNPLVPIYRDAEVGFMLKDCRSRILFVPREFRRFDYAAMAGRLKPELSDLAEIVVVRGEKGTFSGFDELLAEEGAAPPAPPLDPNAVKIIMYTSGTTGRPKGVLHSNNTLHCELRAISDYWRVTPADVIFMPSPVTHVTGYMLALELPWIAGVPAVMLDTWNGGHAVELIREHGCTLTVGATPFLQELLQEAEARGERLPSFRLFACGGASVPPELVRRTFRVLDNCLAFRVYGSTEAPTITTGVRERRRHDLAADTDGEIWNNEVRICDPESGAELPPGAEGEITARGPELFLGYARDEDNDSAFNADGFFRTGDLGRIEHGSFITVTGRKKDLIIRGGENISPKEIEDALHRQPRIREVAAVSMPHARLGETVCLFLVPTDPGAAPQLGEIAAWLEEAGLARQKFPEHLEIVDDLPRTASGKVKKDILRRTIAEKLEAVGSYRS